MTINQLSSLDSFSAGDLLAVFDTSNSDARKASISLLLSYMQNNLTFPSATGKSEFVKQYAAPSATEFNIQVTDTSDNTWLILTPTAGYADGTITLPDVANCADKQEILVNCTQQVTTLVVDGNGATAVTGEPASLGADDFFLMKFDIDTKTWYRVG